MICAFKLLTFLSSTGQPVETREIDRGRRGARPTHHRQFGRLDLDAPIGVGLLPRIRALPLSHSDRSVDEAELNE